MRTCCRWSEENGSLDLISIPLSFLSRYKYKYVIEPVDKPFGNVAVFGHGWSKGEALINLLENWRRGGIHARLECPAGSAEELSIKLAIRGCKA